MATISLRAKTEQTKAYIPLVGRAVAARAVETVPFLFLIIFFALGSFLSNPSDKGNLLIVAMMGILFVALLIWRLVSPFFIATFERYEIGADGIHISSGIIQKKQGILLYNQIQDVQEHQSIGDRWFGIMNLTIKTMAAGQGVGRISNLSVEDGRDLKERLRTRTIQSMGPGRKIVKTIDGNTRDGTSMIESPFPINTKKKAVLWIISLVAIGILGIGASIAGAIALGPLAIGFLPVALAIALIVFFRGLDRIIYSAATSYAIGPDFLEKRYSLIAKTSTRTPFAKIQDILHTRNILDRLLGLAGMEAETGAKQAIEEMNKGEKMSRFRELIPNLNQTDSLKLQEQIIRKMGIKETTTTDLRATYPLERIKPLKKTIGFMGIWGTAIIIAFAVIMWSTMSKPEISAIVPQWIAWAGLLVILVIVTLLNLAYEIAYFKTYDYSDNAEILTLKKGVFTITTLTIPYRNIQHIFVDQDLLDRIFGLYDVHVASAGTTGMELHIDGVNKDNASRLRDLLIRRTTKGTAKR